MSTHFVNWVLNEGNLCKVLIMNRKKGIFFSFCWNKTRSDEINVALYLPVYACIVICEQILTSYERMKNFSQINEMYPIVSKTYKFTDVCIVLII